MNALKFIFILIALSLAFIPIKGELFGYSHLAGKLFDFLHFPFFAVFATLVFSHNKNSNKQKAIRLATLVSFVFAIEAIQFFIGRSASVLDVLWGTLGIAFGWAWHANPAIRYFGLVTFLSAYLLVLGFNLHLLWLTESRLPVVSKMESAFTTRLFFNMNEIKNPKFKTVWSEDKQSQVLQGKKIDYKWSGFSYKYPLLANLQKFSSFYLDYHTPQVIEELEVRFNSKSGYQIYTFHNVKKGWNKLTLDIKAGGNNVDWTAVSSFAVFYESEYGPDMYLVDNVLFK